MKNQFIYIIFSVCFMLPFIASASSNQEKAKSMAVRVATSFQQQNTQHPHEAVKKQLAGIGTSPSKG